MIFLSYLFILTLGSIMHFNKSNFVSSFDHYSIRNKKNILTSKLSIGRNVSSVHRRIIGGHVVSDIRSYPYMAYILRVTKEKNDTFLHTSKETCGSTLLSPTHALSAAHCLRKCHCSQSTEDQNCQKCEFGNVNEYTLYAGSTVANYSTMRSKLKNIYIHPEHKFADFSVHKCLHRFDIGVVELATPLEFSDKIAPIKLPKPVTLGWGYVKEKDNTPLLTEKLKVAQVPLIGLDLCERDLHIIRKRRKKMSGLRKLVCTDTVICSKSRNSKTGICHGDSGGPIICDGVQVGVSSWSKPKCVGPHTPNMFTRVEVCVQWIRDMMSGKNIEGRYMK